MTREKLETLLQEGEGFTLEYKKCTNSISGSVYETVCSFSNRYGGYILLGVDELDGKGVVTGVNPECVGDMKKDFVNMLNNPQKIHPSLYLSLEEIKFDGRIVLWVYVPVSSQIEFCNGKIYDRNEDADQDVSTSSDLVANISNRKSSAYIERKVFPYATMDDLCVDSIRKARRLAVNINKDHPWKDMEDMDILRSAGLYEKNRVTGEEGFNMACILLFGKPEVIQSCVPGYKTDAIYRENNLDRYDDRLIVEDNLVESYDILMHFISMHTNDKFFLIDNVRMSVRSAISRELVSNILVHRDYGSAFPAKIIIGKDKVYTENWNRTQRIGRLELKDFTPYPKNPLLAKFFINIGYADGLGSGVRNLYKYTKIYSGGEPDLEEGDVFRVTVPLTTYLSGDTLDSPSKNLVRDSIGNSYNPAIEDQNPAIGSKNPAIQDKDPAIEDDSHMMEMIEQAIKKCRFNNRTRINIEQICHSIHVNQVFGARDIARIVNCSPSAGRDIINRLRVMKLIEEVKGHGKGRYVFACCKEEV